MKKLFFLAFFAAALLVSCYEDESKTTYYLIRHAEKNKTDKTNRNPNLNEKGLKRAEKWAVYFDNINLDAVYSTNYNRTLRTAEPTAERKHLEVIKYSPRKLYDSIFQKETKGKTVLVVGHSNTTPAMANKILGKKKYSNIDESDNAKLFIITIDRDKISSEVKSIEF
jgi:broad specificity phosphatase PhoE